MIVTTENFLLIGAILLFVAVVAGRVAYRFGAPALLLFLGVGLFFGYDILSFNSPELTQFVGTCALSIILFSGGMDTKISEIRPILAPGITLSTLGVLLTAIFVAAFTWLIAPHFGFTLSAATSLLLASTISSTDSASVFSILRSKKQGLQQNLRPLLELESGSNDPMAYVLVLVLVSILSPSQESMGIAAAIGMFIAQMVIGLALGYLLGRTAIWTINHINFSNASLYSVLLVAFVFFTFSFTTLVYGNGYLAVYIAGLVIGNNKLRQKRVLITFFDGITWLVQIIIFITLGLLVNSRELLQPNTLLFAALIAIFIIVIARPAAVGICLLPFRKFTFRARCYTAWVGLRGAVPIIFATYPLVENIEGSQLIFNVVFIITIISLAVQGTTVSSFANLMGVARTTKEPSFGDGWQDRMKSAFTEIEVSETMLVNGGLLANITLPDNTLVVMVCRDGDYFVPRGSTELIAGDKLLVLSDRGEELDDHYRKLGLDDVIKYS